MTNDAIDNSYPSWSPDSTKLIFISSRDDLQDIHTMSATDGSGPAPAHRHALGGHGPDLALRAD